MNPGNQELAGVCTVAFSVKYDMSNPMDEPYVDWDYARSVEFYTYAQMLLRMADASPPTAFIR